MSKTIYLNIPSQQIVIQQIGKIFQHINNGNYQEGQDYVKDITIQVNCKINDSDMKFILGQQWPFLEEFDLNCNKITKQSMHDLMANPLFALKKLNLSENIIGCNGIKLLIKLQLQNLQCLWIQLEKCQIGNEGMKHLTKGYWPRLRILNLDYNMICLDGHLEVLTNNWSNMTNIWLDQKESIIILHFVGVQWRTVTKMYYKNIVNEEMERDLNLLMKNKFLNNDKSS